MEQHFHIAIIGGGAAGLTAAISALEAVPPPRVVIIEKNRESGRKILATGNGRCNLSNVRCARHKETLDFFSRLGILTRTDEDGRIYPYTEDAADVRDALTERALILGAEFFCGREVESISKIGIRTCLEADIHREPVNGHDDGNRCEGESRAGGNRTVRNRTAVERTDGEFLIRCRKMTGTAGSTGPETFRAKKLILASGGKAGPRFGTTGTGAVLARGLGHTITRLAPALTAVEVREPAESLAGIRAKAEVALKYRDQELFRERGEVQFTKYGVSGICIFNLSRFMVIPEGKSLKNGFDDYRIEIDFLPDVDDAEALLKARREAGIEPAALLRSLVKRRLAERIFARTGGAIPATAKELKQFTLCPKGLKGWDFAQVTKGGVPTSEMDMDTMRSVIVPDLFFAGEIIDYDGPCGGYNLQNAWETGMRAGRAAVAEVMKQ